jgi:adenylate cyclase
MNKVYIHVILSCFLITTICFAQDKKKNDSLFALANSAKEDKVKVDAWNELAYIFRNTEPDTVIYFTTHALELATKLNYKSGIADAYLWMALAFTNVGKYDEALEKCSAALNIYDRLIIGASPSAKKRLLKQKARSINITATTYYYQGNYTEAVKYQMLVLDIANKLEDMNLLTSSYQNIGVYYKEQGNYSGALKNDFICLKIYEKIKDKNGIADCYGNIGTIYEEQKNYDQALFYYLKGSVLKKEIKDKKGIAIAYTNIGNVYRKQGKSNASLANYLLALEIDKAMDDKFSLTNDFISIGIIWQNRGENSKALETFFEALKISEEINAKHLVSLSKLAIGEIYRIQGNLNSAEEFLNSALQLALESGSNDAIQNIYSQLAALDSAKGKWKNAYTHHKLFMTYRDSVFNEKNTKEMTAQFMQYDFDKKESINKAEQEKKDAIAQEEMQKQKLVRNVFVGGFALVSLFAGVFFTQRNKIKNGKKRSDELLLNILPETIAEELKAKGTAEAKLLDSVTVLFTDFKGFTQLSEKLNAKQLVAEINECFSVFDQIMTKHNIEKIKTIGDAYMAAGGLPILNTTHATDVINAALDIQQFMQEHKTKKEASGKLFFEIRIGVHSGPVVAGIVGVKKFAYDIWGDTVNTASRMESSGEAGKINISGSTYELVKEKFTCVHRGKIHAKNKGEIDMYFVESCNEG